MLISEKKPIAFPQLIELAVRGLERMFDRERCLFVHSLRRSRGELRAEGLSPRYTLMTLLGLRCLEQEGGRSPVEIAPALRRLVEDVSWITGAGDLGLLLWAVARIAPTRFAEVAERVDAAGALVRYKDARQGHTMELAWYLTGLSYGLQGDAGISGRAGNAFSEKAAEAFRFLIANQGTRGIFGHLAAGKSVAGRLRGRIGSFADQVYPIYALVQFSKAVGQSEALARALDCARTICEHQGPNGEWWWHYDSATGKVAETYPVYSVHQDGMAPMALLALADAAGEDFAGPVGRGLEWIGGRNDLAFDMRSEADGVIWRNFYLPRTERLLQQLLGAGGEVDRGSIGKLRVNFECRPYELGWALYALCGR